VKSYRVPAYNVSKHDRYIIDTRESATIRRSRPRLRMVG
jgi:hypothetical protein